MEGEIPECVRERLLRSEQDPRPVVVMTCGVAGSGKSTLAKAIAAAYPSFARVSIDQIIHQRHGLYGVDYDPARHGAHQTEADALSLDALARLLYRERRDVVLDRAFCARADRAEYRGVAEAAGARVVLVYLRPEGTDALWRRIGARAAAGKDADSAPDTLRELLERCVAEFEPPDGEGEVVVEVK